MKEKLKQAMKNWHKSISLLAIIGMAVMGMSSSALAVQDSDVSTTIVTPESGEDVKAGDFLTNGVGYVVEMENTGNNDTTVDTKVTLQSDGDSQSVWVNGTSVDSGETVEVDGTVSVEDFNLSTDGKDANITADSTYTDDGDSTTATSSDTVNFTLTESQLFSLLLGVGVLIAVFGMFSDL